MKLCQKCIDAIKQVAPLDYDIRVPKADIFQEATPESECEFWAHKEKNEAAISAIDELAKIIQDSLNNRAFVTEEIVRLRMKLLSSIGESVTSYDQKHQGKYLTF